VQFDYSNSIKLDIPAGWGFTRDDGTPLPDIGESFNVELMPPSGVKASLTVTIGKTKTGKPLTQKQFDSLAKKQADRIMRDAVEKKATFKEIPIHGGRGTYCIFTDASLVNKTVGSHEYKYVGLLLGNYDNGCVTYGTALTDDPNGADFQLMLKAFSSIEPSFGITAPPVQITKTKQGTLIGSAVSSKKLLLPSQTLKTKNDRYGGGTDAAGYFYLEDTKLQVLISGWIEPAAKFHYANVREMWSSENADKARHKSPMPANEDYQKIGDWEVYLYDVPVPPRFGNATNSNLRANYLDKQIWIDVHLSMTQPMPSNILRDMLLMYFKTLSITDTGAGK